MNPRARQDGRPISESALADAAAWVVKLHGPGRDAALESGWRAWLAEDPAHAAAWERTSNTWTSSHEIAPAIALRPMRGLSTAKDHRRRLAYSLAAAAAVAALAVIGWKLNLFGQVPVTTAVGEQRILNLRDGTRIELNTNTRLLVQYGNAERRIVLKSGEALFAVAHESRPFIVMVGNHKVVALGTSFVVRGGDLPDDAVTVTLLEGRVAVTPASSSEIQLSRPQSQVTMLRSGQRLQVRANEEPAVDAPAMDRATSWIRGTLMFDNTELAEAAAELNRYSTLRISVDSSAARTRIGGVFRLGDSESFAHAVADSYHLKLTTRGDELILQPLQAP